MILTFLGQAGFLIEIKRHRFLIDPYLSNYVVSSGIGSAEYFSREFKPPFSPTELGRIDAIFITHDHADHCDPLTLMPILSAQSQCVIYGPFTVAAQLRSLRVNPYQARVISVGKPVIIESVTVKSIPSAHYELESDGATGEYPFLGFVFNLEGSTVYHSGDTILYEGLVERLAEISSHYDLACLPVNGRDKAREDLGITGNLMPEEALKLAASINSKILIPMHNDLFKINSMDPNILDEIQGSKYPDLEVKWLKAGESLNS
jgi:L-ascorbate metabolism protein UlaG (beta-lactamase superfamily)